MLGDEYEEVCDVLARIREHLIDKYDYDLAAMCSSPHEVALNTHDYIKKLEERVKELEGNIRTRDMFDKVKEELPR